jgi:molybdate transport system substrate-binding protein
MMLLVPFNSLRRTLLFVFSRIEQLPVGCAILVLTAAMAQAAQVHVAVAANFVGTLDRLATAFEASSGNTLVASSGSTGTLYAQIRNGAPYDVLLAADAEHPKRLEQAGLAVPGSRFTYARGQLVLWSRDPGRVDREGRVLRTDTFRHLAIANPGTAPYGAAAQQALQHLGLWSALAPRLVRGENIGQTFQFVYGGNAELGFVALAQVRQLNPNTRGSWWVVPPKLYDPIEQQGVLLTRARGNAAARAFLTFLQGKRARDIIQADGYGPG